MWSDLLAAVGLMLVLEGVFPFLNPQGLRRTLAEMNKLTDQTLRTVGLISMLGGLALLYFR